MKTINNNPQKVFDICKENFGMKLRNMGYNFKGTLDNSILGDLNKHKILILSIKPFCRKIKEWEDNTSNKVFIEISF